MCICQQQYQKKPEEELKGAFMCIALKRDELTFSSHIYFGISQAQSEQYFLWKNLNSFFLPSTIFSQPLSALMYGTLTFHPRFNVSFKGLRRLLFRDLLPGPGTLRNRAGLCFPLIWSSRKVHKGRACRQGTSLEK